MNKGDMVFVYGTLLPGERADLAKGRMHFDVDLLGQDEINGKLYSLGPFPGLKIVGNGDFDPGLPIVKGMVFFLQNNSVGAILDAYEGYHSDNPTSGLYNRAQVLSKQGRVVWTYTYNGHLLEEQLIETGDWKNPRLASNHRHLSWNQMK